MEIANRILLGSRRSISPQEVILLTAHANYTQVYLQGGRIVTVATTLKTLEKRFAACSDFFPYPQILFNQPQFYQALQRFE